MRVCAQPYCNLLGPALDILGGLLLGEGTGGGVDVGKRGGGRRDWEGWREWETGWNVMCERRIKVKRQNKTKACIVTLAEIKLIS